MTPSLRRRRAAVVGAVAVIVGLVATLLVFGLGRDPRVVGSLLVGRRAPDFALETLDGSDTIRPSDLRGQVVVVNFWASWCGPCREEHPDLMAAWNRYRDRGVVLVGVQYQDTVRAGLEYLEELGGDWPHVVDPGGKTALDFGVIGVPETYFIDRDGRIVSKHAGAVTFDLLTEQITTLLGGRS